MLNVVVSHQVKHKDIQRRKSFLRAKNYVNFWNQSQSNKIITDSKLKQLTQATPSLLPQPTPKTTTHMARLPAFYDNNSRGLDYLTAMPSIREKLSSVLDAVDKSLAPSEPADKSRKGSDTQNNAFTPHNQYPTTGDIYNSTPRKGRNRAHGTHQRQRSKLFADLRREITRRGTDHSTC